MKRKNNKMYLLNTDIEELNKRYEVLYKQIKDNPNLTKEQIDRECEVLLEKYNFEIEEFSALREVEYETQRAKIEARNQEQIPWRRCWLWRLLFRPLTNRAQDIIEEEAALEANVHFTALEKELEARAARVYNADGRKLSRRERKNLLKKYLKNECTLEEILHAADEAAPGEVFEQPEPPAAVADVQSGAEQQPDPAAQPSEPAEPAPSSCNAVHHSDVADEKDTGNVAEPPELPARKPRKSKQAGA